MDVFWQAPPVSRTLTAATLVVSILAHTGLISFYWFVFYVPNFLKLPPEIWRLATCFMLTGPQLGILLDPFFLYTYGSRLETGSPRFSQPGDFFVYIVFVCLTIMGLNLAFTGSMVFTAALILAFTYTACQDDRGGKSTFYVVTIPTQWVPLGMILMTLVMAGPDAAIVQITGLVAAHLYDFLTRIYPTFGGGRNLLPTPAFVRRWFASTEPAVTNRAYGTAFTPGQNTSRASTTGASAGSVLPESWRSRGTGHRLGGD